MWSNDSINRLHLIFRDEAAFKSCVSNWLGEFQRGLSKLGNEFREGHRSTSVASGIDSMSEIGMSHNVRFKHF